MVLCDFIVLKYLFFSILKFVKSLKFKKKAFTIAQKYFSLHHGLF